MLLYFSRNFLQGEGDITKHLSNIGYRVSHTQSSLDEFNYQVNNLALDLRDGIRLSRLLELLTQGWGLSKKLRPPATSLNPRLGNTKHFLDKLEELTHFNFNISSRLQLLLEWSSVICRVFGLRGTDFTSSFKDGGALCNILHYYHPALLSKHFISGDPKSNLEEFSKKLSSLGGIPILPPASDFFQTGPNEKVVNMYLAYLCGQQLEIRAGIVIQRAYRKHRGYKARRELAFKSCEDNKLSIHNLYLTLQFQWSLVKPALLYCKRECIPLSLFRGAIGSGLLTNLLSLSEITAGNLSVSEYVPVQSGTVRC